MKITLKQMRVLKTAVLYFSAIATGMSFAVIGPTLLDLQHLVNTDTKKIAFVYTARSNGYLFGSLLGGAVFDMTPRKQLVMTVLNGGMAASVFAIPWSRSVAVLTSWMVLSGACNGAIDTGLNVCVLQLWGKDSGPFYQALHFIWGFGGLVSPLIAAQFVGDYSSSLTINGTTTAIENLNANSSSSVVIPPITYTYGAIASVAIAVTVCFSVLSAVSPFDDNCKKTEEEQTRKRGWMFVSVVVLITFLLLFVETGTEIGYAQMLTTYAVKGPLKLSTITGSYMTSTFWGAFTVSRFASIFLAIRLNSFTLLLMDIVVTSIGSVVLLILGQHQEWALWLATLLLGMGIASFFPTAVAYVEQYIHITNKIVAFFTVGGAFGEMVIPYTISVFIEEVPAVLSYVVLASCILSIILTFFLHLILRKKQTKYMTEEGTPNETYKSKVDS